MVYSDILPLLVAAAAAAAAPLATAADIPVAWFIPGPAGLTPVSAKVGDTLVFEWDFFHNVYKAPSNSCSNLMGGSFLGDSSPVRYTVTEDDVGTLTFACGVPGHCAAGQLLSVAVAQAVDPAAAEAPTAASDDVAEEEVAEEEVAATSDPSCEDTNASCESWASSGECEANPAYMVTNCAKSCGECEAAAPAPASGTTTTAPTSAPTSAPTLAPTLAPTSAPTGPAGAEACEDMNASCEAWAARGECGTNPSYMISNCFKSCGCGGPLPPSPVPRPRPRPVPAPTRISSGYSF